MAFLCLDFVLRVFQTPELGLIPAIIVLAIFSSRIRLPFRIPGGLVCLVVGALLAALLKWTHLYHLPMSQVSMKPGIYLPHPLNLISFVIHGEGWKFLSVILPMSVLDTIVSLQVLESVQVAGTTTRLGLAAGQRTGDAGRGTLRQPVSDGALLRAYGA